MVEAFSLDSSKPEQFVDIAFATVSAVDVCLNAEKPPWRASSAGDAIRLSPGRERVRSVFCLSREACTEYTNITGSSVNYGKHAGDMREAVGEFDRLSDLIVVFNSKACWEMPIRLILEARLHRTARSILVLAPESPLIVGTRIATALNDSVESPRAAAASLGWLKAAGSVVGISCRENNVVSLDPQILDEYLTGHDIDAEAIGFDKPPRSAEWDFFVDD